MMTWNSIVAARKRKTETEEVHVLDRFNQSATKENGFLATSDRECTYLFLAVSTSRRCHVPIGLFIISSLSAVNSSLSAAISSLSVSGLHC